MKNMKEPRACGPQGRNSHSTSECYGAGRDSAATFGISGYYCSPSFDSIREVLEPLVRQIRCYDEIQNKLRTQGGRVFELNRITEILCKKLSIEADFRTYEVSLADRQSLRHMLGEIGNGDVFLDVRLVGDVWPVYYLCRTLRDFWSEYGLVVEDLHVSPSYPTADPRFIKLMQFGHEKFFLRISHLRSAARTIAERENGATESEVDSILYDVGRHVLQAAWHEDQRLGVLVARHFGIEHFQNAIELLYLALSGELCDLRREVNDKMLRFFETAYPQPAIQSFLRMLPDLTGEELNKIPETALRLYLRLSKAFGGFLRTEVSWKRNQTRVPLYKLVFGNFTRLDLIAKRLQNKPSVLEAVAELANESRRTIESLLSNPSG